MKVKILIMIQILMQSMTVVVIGAKDAFSNAALARVLNEIYRKDNTAGKFQN